MPNNVNIYLFDDIETVFNYDDFELYWYYKRTHIVIDEFDQFLTLYGSKFQQNLIDYNEIVEK